MELGRSRTQPGSDRTWIQTSMACLHGLRASTVLHCLRDSPEPAILATLDQGAGPGWSVMGQAELFLLVPVAPASWTGCVSTSPFLLPCSQLKNWKLHLLRSARNPEQADCFPVHCGRKAKFTSFVLLSCLHTKFWGGAVSLAFMLHSLLLQPAHLSCLQLPPCPFSSGYCKSLVTWTLCPTPMCCKKMSFEIT